MTVYESLFLSLDFFLKHKSQYILVYSNLSVHFKGKRDIGEREREREKEKQGNVKKIGGGEIRFFLILL